MEEVLPPFLFHRSYPTARYVGIYKVDEPALLIRDLDLIKDILVTKFTTFNKNDFALDPEVSFEKQFFEKLRFWKSLMILLKKMILNTLGWEFCESLNF